MKKARLIYCLMAVVSILVFACKTNSLNVVKKEASISIPGRQMGTKFAQYKVVFIPPVGSDKITFQKVMFQERELAISLFDNKNKKQTAFNALDTVHLFFGMPADDAEPTNVIKNSFELYYFENNKLKKIRITDFEFLQTPINP